ncbi:MAG: hypothetical protein VZQ47_06960 [Treponema sp.]|nr:hypothetical protein [Treponema sp.]MEE3435279.1 hypothetical protein [Treponema sp.]
MEIYLNEQKLDITLEDEKTVGDVLRSFEQTASQNKCATVGIKIDGKQIDAQDFDKAAEQPIESAKRIDLTVVSEDAVADAFKKASADIKDTVELLTQIPAQLQNGGDSKAKASIARLADVVDNFCHIIALSTLFPERFAAIKIDGKNLSAFFEDFMPIFNDLNGALSNGDTVTLGDLAEYEISPRLTALADAVKNI